MNKQPVIFRNKSEFLLQVVKSYPHNLKRSGDGCFAVCTLKELATIMLGLERCRIEREKLLDCLPENIREDIILYSRKPSYIYDDENYQNFINNQIDYYLEGIKTTIQLECTRLDFASADFLNKVAGIFNYHATIFQNLPEYKDKILKYKIDIYMDDVFEKYQKEEDFATFFELYHGKKKQYIIGHVQINTFAAALKKYPFLEKYMAAVKALEWPPY